MDPERILICEDGDQVVLTDGGLMRGERVRAGHLYVDGIVGDVGRGVLRDRRVLAEEGVVVVIVAVDSQERPVVSGPELITRGWVYAPEAEDLLDEAVAVDPPRSAGRAGRRPRGARGAPAGHPARGRAASSTSGPGASR